MATTGADRSSWTRTVRPLGRMVLGMVVGSIYWSSLTGKREGGRGKRDAEAGHCARLKPYYESLRNNHTTVRRLSPFPLPPSLPSRLQSANDPCLSTTS